MITEAIVRTLNEMLVADPGAVHSLIDHRVPCNESLIDHPTIQVEKRDSWTSVGLLGVLNGIAGREDGQILAIWNEEFNRITHFEARVKP